MRSRPCLTGILFGLLASAAALAQPSPARYHANGYLIVRLVGTPEEMGRQQGQLIGPLVRRVVREVIGGEATTERAHRELLAGAMVMERYLPDDIRRELRALAETAGVSYSDLVALQLFGDVQRGRSPSCSAYAAFGPATLTGECIAGRNLDFWDHGVSEYAAVILHYFPSDGIPFMTITWAGIINGWTTMNHRGVIASNNTAYGGSDSMDGLSTCFMVRKVAQHAATVAEGVEIVRSTPRACGTNLFIAGGSPPAAAVVEFDHEQLAVRWAQDGYAIATNSFRTLYQDPPLSGEEGWCSRYSRLRELICDHYGKTDRSMNFAGAPGVPLGSINLHSAVLFPADLSFKVSMGRMPACEHSYRGLRMTEEGIVPVH